MRNCLAPSRHKAAADKEEVGWNEEESLWACMAEGESGGEEGASEKRKMRATKYVLSSAILGLFWSGLFKGVLTNSTSRCDYSPCSCDHYGRLTCDCKEEGEVGSFDESITIFDKIFAWESIFARCSMVETSSWEKSTRLCMKKRAK